MTVNLKNNKTDTQIIDNVPFVDEKIIIDEIDYYYSNVIARASHTMYECRKKKIELKKTGTEG